MKDFRITAWCPKCLTIKLIQLIVSTQPDYVEEAIYAKVQFKGCGHRVEIATSQINLNAIREAT